MIMKPYGTGKSSGAFEEVSKVKADIAEVTSQLADIAAQYADKNVKVVFAILRNPSGTWLLAEGSHSPVNVGSITQNATQVIVNYDFTGVNVLGNCVVLDETLSKMKYFCGASVELDKLRIEISQNRCIGGYVYYDGSAWVCSGDAGLSAAFSGGILTITHPSINGVKASAMCRDGAYNVYLGGTPMITSTQTKLIFKTHTGDDVSTPDTNMNVMFTRHSSDDVLDPSVVKSGYGNLWVCAFIEV